jgi:hypothetical protein
VPPVFASWAAEESGLEGSNEFVYDNINKIMTRGALNKSHQFNMPALFNELALGLFVLVAIYQQNSNSLCTSLAETFVFLNSPYYATNIM